MFYKVSQLVYYSQYLNYFDRIFELVLTFSFASRNFTLNLVKKYK